MKNQIVTIFLGSLILLVFSLIYAGETQAGPISDVTWIAQSFSIQEISQGDTNPRSSVLISPLNTDPPSIDIEKTGLFNDESGDGFAQVGETITYDFDVTNTGATDILNIVVTDSIGPTTVCTVSTLSPGQMFNCEWSYAITQADIDAGKRTNQGDAVGTVLPTFEEVKDADIFEIDLPSPPPLEPDLTATKTNDTSNEVAVFSTFDWTIAIANGGTGAATFSSGQLIFQDDLPAGAEYDTPYINSVIGVTNSGNISCSVTTNTLTCTAISADVTVDANGSFNIILPTTPTTGDTLDNPAANGVCQVDPNELIDEITTKNNDCDDSVAVEGKTITFSKVVSGGTASADDFTLNIGDIPQLQNVPFGDYFLPLGELTVTENGPDGYAPIIEGDENICYIDDADAGEILVEVGLYHDFSTCTITNEFSGGSLTIIKEATPEDGTNFAFSSDIPKTAYGIIDTIAGSGVAGFSGDGALAANATFDGSNDVTLDSAGNIYIADSFNHRIRKIDANTGIIDTVAGSGPTGSGNGSFSGDGSLATAATLNTPAFVALDNAGNLFISDTDNQRIRRVDANTGIITTVAGTGSDGFSGDGGLAINAKLDSPQGIAVDSFGNLYLADNDNHRIRKVDVNTGIITTIAGTGSTGFSGDGGPAINAELNEPWGISFDGQGNLYIADNNNNRIRKVDTSSGIITTVAGTGSFDFSGDGGPAANAKLFAPFDVTVDSAGNLFISEAWRIRRVDSQTGFISTVVGSGADKFGGDGGLAINAGLEGLAGIGIDNAGNLYLAEFFPPRIRQITAVSSVATFTLDDAAPDDGDDIVQSITFNDIAIGTHAITELLSDGWRLDSASCIGAGGGFNLTDTTLSVAVGLDEEITCTFNNSIQLGDLTIRKEANPADGADFDFKLTTFTSALQTPFFSTWGSSGSAEGQFIALNDLAIDSLGHIYAADGINHRIQKFDSNGTIIEVWGWGVATGANAFEICTSGCLSGLPGAGNGQFNFPVGIIVDSLDNVYVADGNNNRIQKFNSAGNFDLTWGSFGSGDSQFFGPNDIAVDSSDNTYVVDRMNHRIQKFDSSGGLLAMWGWGVATGANNFEICIGGCQQGIAGSGDGQFDRVRQVAVDGLDNVYVADQNNARIQKFNSSGTLLEVWGWGVATGAGNFEVCTSGCLGGSAGAGDGQFAATQGMAVDGSNNLYVTDFDTERIQKFDSSGNLLEVWGWGVATGAHAFEICTSNCRVGLAGDGRGQFENLVSVVVDSAGNVYTADQGNERIQKFSTTVPFTLDDEAIQTDAIEQSITFSDLFIGSYAITETVPGGWELNGAGCTGGSDPGSLIDQTLSVALAAGEDVICTFYNVAIGELSIKVNKDVDPSEVWEPGGDVEFIFDIWNNGAVPVTISDIDDSFFGNLSDECDLPVQLAVGQTYTCRFTEYIGGNGGDIHYNRVTVTAEDSQGNEVQDTSDEDVHILDIPSSIKVSKDAAKSEVLEPGEDLLFTITAKNTSQVDMVTIEKITDSVFGDLTAECLATGPKTLQIGQTFTCEFTRFVGGQTGDIHNNTITVSGTDDDGQSVSGSDGEQVLVDNVPSSIKVGLQAGPEQVHEPGADVTFTVDVRNSSAADGVTINQVTDSIFGDLTAECLDKGPVSLTPGEAYACTFVRFIGEQAGEIHSSIVVVFGLDDDGHAVSDSAGESVGVIDTPSSLLITKTAEPDEIVAPGSDVTFTVEVLNDSETDTVTVTTLSDTAYPGMSDNCAPTRPATLQPGESITCQLTTYVGGQAGDVISSRAAAAGTDDDGYPVGDAGEVEITILSTPLGRYAIFMPTIGSYR